MSRYQFYVVTGGEVAASVDLEFADEDAALAAARHGLVRGQEIEVWRGLQWIGLVEDRDPGLIKGGLSWPIQSCSGPATPFTWRHETDRPDLPPDPGRGDRTALSN